MALSQYKKSWKNLIAFTELQEAYSYGKLLYFVYSSFTCLTCARVSHSMLSTMVSYAVQDSFSSCTSPLWQFVQSLRPSCTQEFLSFMSMIIALLPNTCTAALQIVSIEHWIFTLILSSNSGLDPRLSAFYLSGSSLLVFGPSSAFTTTSWSRRM